MFALTDLFYLLQPISQWTSTNVVEWMAALNLYRYAELFRSKDIKGVDLLSLDKDKLMVRSAIYFLDPIGEAKRNMRDASLRRCWMAAIRPRDVNAKMAEPRRREIRIATSSIPRMPTLSLFQFRIVRKGRWVRRRRSDGPNKLSISEAASSDFGGLSQGRPVIRATGAVKKFPKNYTEALKLSLETPKMRPI